MKLHKGNRGITLVALVVTIIILLILAGISIASLIGNGLFEKAELAKEKQEDAQINEDATLADYENSINGYLNNSNREENLNSLKKYNIIETISTYNSTYGTNNYYSYDLDISSITTTAKSDGIIAWGSTTDEAAYNIIYYRVLDDTTIRFFFNGSFTNQEFIFTIIK